MLVREKIEDRITRLAKSVAAREGYDLYDIEYRTEGRRWILRIYLDSDQGITIDDCQRFSKAISVHLDVEDLISHKYYLEVSSPGVERRLRDERDYRRFRGKTASIHLKCPCEGKKHLIGRIMGLENGTLEFEDEQLGTLKIALGDISRGRLRFSYGSKTAAKNRSKRLNAEGRR